MSVFIASFVIMLAVVAAMSVGVMFNRRPIKGSCGGLASQDGYDCICARTGERRCETAP